MMMMMTMMTIIKVIVMRGSDGQQLPWESNLWTKCRPSVDQVETKQGWAQPGPTHCLLSTWSTPGLHLVYTWSASTNLSSFVMHTEFSKCTPQF